MPISADDPAVSDTLLGQRIERDLRWLGGARALVDAATWQDAGVLTASCVGWRVPTWAELSLSGEAHPWWRQKNRLGHHFEHLHAGLLRAQPGVIIHALNLPLRTSSETLGEIDCLFTNAAGEVVHREVAVKYFLSRKESPRASDWVGTSKVDRLDLKIERLARHQTQLSSLARQQGAWPSALPFPTRREVLLLGGFFRHRSHRAWPEVMGPDAESGFWCDSDEFSQQAGATSRWACLHKPWWLSAEHRESAPVLPAHAIVEIVEQEQRAHFVARPHEVSDAGFNGRGFVVPRGWNAEAS